MQKTSKPSDLQAVAKQTRRLIIEMVTAAKSGHPGGSLSAVEILVTLFYDVLRHDPANPHWPDRDRFILSKGHACPVLYAVMAECGYTPIDELKNRAAALAERLKWVTFRSPYQRFSTADFARIDY